MSENCDTASFKAELQGLLAEVSSSPHRDTSQDCQFASLLGSESLLVEKVENVKTPHAGFGVKSAQGLSRHMEDSYTVKEKLSSPGLESHSSHHAHDDDEEISLPGFSEDLAFFSVFDGHGGNEVAQHCSDRLHKHFMAQLLSGICGPADGAASDAPDQSPRYDEDCIMAAAALTAASPSLITDALRSSFHRTDQELAGTETGEYVGATAVVAVIGRQHIWVAHCGDSRAVLQRSGDAIALTSDHKPDREDEAERIKAAGGRIVYNSGASRVQGMLAMSRAIGDHYLRPYVIAEPEVTCIERLKEDEVLIIATDGLWDVFTCTEATNLARRCILRSIERGMSKNGACRVAATVLAKAAMERGSRDNITVIIIDISLLPSESLADIGQLLPASAMTSRPDGVSRLLHANRSSSMGKYLLLKSQKQKQQDRRDRSASHEGGPTSDAWRHTSSHNDLHILCDVQPEASSNDLNGPSSSLPSLGSPSSRFKSSPALALHEPVLSEGSKQTPEGLVSGLEEVGVEDLELESQQQLDVSSSKSAKDADDRFRAHWNAGPASDASCLAALPPTCVKPAGGLPRQLNTEQKVVSFRVGEDVAAAATRAGVAAGGSFTGRNAAAAAMPTVAKPAAASNDSSHAGVMLSRQAPDGQAVCSPSGMAEFSEAACGKLVASLSSGKQRPDADVDPAQQALRKMSLSDDAAHRGHQPLCAHRSSEKEVALSCP